MIALKLLLTVAGVVLLAAALTIPLYSLWLRIRDARRKTEDELAEIEPQEIHWRGSVALALVACLPLLIATSIVVVPSGMGGVRISQIGGTEPGTLYPGMHFVTPMVENIQLFDLRDHLFTAGVAEETAKAAADKAKLTGRAQALDPMPNYERRLIHSYLQEHHTDMESISIDNDPYRRVVIRIRK